MMSRKKGFGCFVLALVVVLPVITIIGSAWITTRDNYYANLNQRFADNHISIMYSSLSFDGGIIMNTKDFSSFLTWVTSMNVTIVYYGSVSQTGWNGKYYSYVCYFVHDGIVYTFTPKY
jgi:hypothetical protein